MSLNISNASLSEFLTRQYLDRVFTGANLTGYDVTLAVVKGVFSPEIGDHLITPRSGYTHHGIYVGGDTVVHYAGLAKGISAGPIEEISLIDFQNQRGVRIREHLHASFRGDEVVSRAMSRLNEDNYHLAFNNCEHFVYWCLYNRQKSSQVDSVKNALAYNAATKVGVALYDASTSFVSYLKGDISKERLLEEISEVSCGVTSVAYYSMLGQIAIPVPGIGPLIGAGMGIILSNMLNQSGLIALGEAPVVKQAKKKRQEVESLCRQLVPEIKKSRRNLEEYLDKYFKERQKTFMRSFDDIETAIKNWDSDNFSDALGVINMQYGKILKYKNFDDFSTAMLLDKPLGFR